MNMPSRIDAEGMFSYQAKQFSQTFHNRESNGEQQHARNVELEHNSAVPEHVHAITLVRHGRTAYNAQHRLQGQIDIPLDEVGQWQVRQTADALRELYVDRRPDIPNRLVICSDLGRAAATAHAFADRWAWKCIPTSACVNAASAIGKHSG